MKTQNFRSKSKTFFLSIALLAFAFLFLALETSFAQAVDLGIYPPIFQVVTTPPADVKAPFFIQNYSDNAVILKVALKPFEAADSEDGQITFLNNASSYPDPFLLDRVGILDKGTPLNSLTLSPKQRKDLTLEIKIPGNEIKGDYYFTLVFYSVNSPATTSNESFTKTGIASNVLLSVGPVGPTQGTIEDFSAAPFVTSGPVPFTLRVKNTSNHYITPKGNILITNVFGQTVGKIDLLPVNILSDTIRRIPDSLQSPTAKPSQSLKSYFLSLDSPYAVWPEKFLLGPYTANLTLYLSSSGPVFKRKIVFFALPVEYILAFVLLAIIVVFIVSRVRKRLYR